MMKELERPDDACESSCELLVDPIPRPRAQRLSISTRPKQRRVKILDSRKPNSIVVMRLVAGILRDAGVEVDPDIRMKDDPSRPIEADVLDWIARDEGLLLCGIAD